MIWRLKIKKRGSMNTLEDNQSSIIESIDDVVLYEQYISAHNDLICENRRNLLKLATGAVAATSLLGVFAMQPGLAKEAVTKERELRIFTPALGETTRIIYWIPGEGYIRESLDEISWALRDRRTKTAKLYDPHVLDQLYALRLQLNYHKPTHALSGYRSPQTNAMLSRQQGGVAKDSFHMRGRAVDIRMPGTSVSNIKRAALSLKAGGVGYYSRSNFVHIDSGQVRTWGR